MLIHGLTTVVFSSDMDKKADNNVKTMHHGKRNTRIAIGFCLLATTMALNLSSIFLNPTISKNLTLQVKFAESTGKIVTPVWRALNIWDITQIPGLLSNINAFRANYPVIDTLVLMTATGGRPNGSWYTLSNDYVHRNASGGLVFDFTDLFTATDLIVGAGFKIVLVIGNVPHDLANKTSFTTEDYGAFEALTLPPANYTEYAWYISNLTAACIGRYGFTEVSSWEFRLMTEPDNRDWWTASVDEYIDLWLATFMPLKSLIPEAKTVLGNMAWHDEHAFAETVLAAVKAANDTLLPDTLSFSYYHSLGKSEPPSDLRDLVTGWESVLGKLQLGKPIDITCEEGFILVDEDNKRLWGGDGTELGAAWDAWMLESIEGTSFRRFVQWSPQYGGYLAPRNYVHLAAERMACMDLVPVELKNAPFARFAVRASGFAAKNATAGEYRVMIYQYSPIRGDRVIERAQIEISGLPAGTYNITEYRIDPVHHNWFNAWLEASKELFTYPDGSRYDLSLSNCFNMGAGTPARIAWDNFKASHVDPKNLIATSWERVTLGTGGRVSRDTQLDANCVILLECNLIP